MGKSTPYLSTIEYWGRWFQSGDMSTTDRPRPGQPKTAISDEDADKVVVVVMVKQLYKRSKVTGNAYAVEIEKLKQVFIPIRGVKR